MQLAPVRATIVSTEDRLAIAKERLIGTVRRLVQADGDALHASRGAEQALLAWLRAVLDGPGAVRVARLHEPAYFAHRRRTLGQRQGVLHLDEGEGSRRGVDAPAPVDRIRFEVSLDRTGEGFRRFNPERFLLRLHEGLQHAAIVSREPPELGVAPRRLF